MPATSIRGVELVAAFEGFPNQGRPYDDPKGFATVGYGHLLGYRPVTPADRQARWVSGQQTAGRLTEAEARRLLVERLDGPDYGGAVDRVAARLGRALTVGQRDALVSAVFNLGAGVLEPGRSLGDALRQSGWRTAVPAALLLYSEPGNPSVHAGLLRRRRAEAQVWRDNTIPAALTPEEARRARQTLDLRRRRTGGAIRARNKAWFVARLAVIARGAQAHRPARRAFLRRVIGR